MSDYNFGSAFDEIKKQTIQENLTNALTTPNEKGKDAVKAYVLGVDPKVYSANKNEYDNLYDTTVYESHKPDLAEFLASTPHVANYVAKDNSQFLLKMKNTTDDIIRKAKYQNTMYALHERVGETGAFDLTDSNTKELYDRSQSLERDLNNGEVKFDWYDTVSKYTVEPLYDMALSVVNHPYTYGAGVLGGIGVTALTGGTGVFAGSAAFAAAQSSADYSRVRGSFIMNEALTHKGDKEDPSLGSRADTYALTVSAFNGLAGAALGGVVGRASSQPILQLAKESLAMGVVGGASGAAERLTYEANSDATIGADEMWDAVLHGSLSGTFSALALGGGSKVVGSLVEAKQRSAINTQNRNAQMRALSQAQHGASDHPEIAEAIRNNLSENDAEPSLSIDIEALRQEKSERIDAALEKARELGADITSASEVIAPIEIMARLTEDEYRALEDHISFDGEPTLAKIKKGTTEYDAQQELLKQGRERARLHAEGVKKVRAELSKQIYQKDTLTAFAGETQRLGVDLATKWYSSRSKLLDITPDELYVLSPLTIEQQHVSQFRQEVGHLGETVLPEEGGGTIKFYKNADASTFVHEFAHYTLENDSQLYHNIIGGEEISPQAQNWMDAMDATYEHLGFEGMEDYFSTKETDPARYREAQEKYATLTEKYFLEGVERGLPAGVLKNVDSWSRLLTSISHLLNLDGAEISPKMRQALTNLYHSYDMENTAVLSDPHHQLVNKDVYRILDESGITVDNNEFSDTISKLTADYDARMKKLNNRSFKAFEAAKQRYTATQKKAVDKMVAKQMRDYANDPNTYLTQLVSGKKVQTSKEFMLENNTTKEYIAMLRELGEHHKDTRFGREYMTRLLQTKKISEVHFNILDEQGFISKDKVNKDGGLVGVNPEMLLINHDRLPDMFRDVIYTGKSFKEAKLIAREFAHDKVLGLEKAKADATATYHNTVSDRFAHESTKVLNAMARALKKDVNHNKDDIAYMMKHKVKDTLVKDITSRYRNKIKAESKSAYNEGVAFTSAEGGLVKAYDNMLKGLSKGIEHTELEKQHKQIQKYKSYLTSLRKNREFQLKVGSNTYLEVGKILDYVLGKADRSAYLSARESLMKKLGAMSGDEIVYGGYFDLPFIEEGGMTLRDLEKTHDTIKSVVAQNKVERSINAVKKQETDNAIRTEIDKSLELITRERAEDVDVTQLRDVTTKVRDSMLNTKVFLAKYTGKQESFIYKHFIDPINRSMDSVNAFRVTDLLKMLKARTKADGEMPLNYGHRINVKGEIHELTHSNLLAIACHATSPSGRKALADNLFHVPPEELMPILEKEVFPHITKADLDYIKEYNRTSAKAFKVANDAYTNRTGMQITPIETESISLAGVEGAMVDEIPATYLPLQYKKYAEAIPDLTLDEFGSHVNLSDNGYIEERTFTVPRDSKLHLDFEALTLKGTASVMHDGAYRNNIIEFNKFFGDIKASLESKYGEHYGSMIAKALRNRVKLAVNGDPAQTGMLDRFAQHSHHLIMSANMSVSLSQIAGIAPIMLEHPLLTSRALSKVITNWRELRKLAIKESPRMEASLNATSALATEIKRSGTASKNKALSKVIKAYGQSLDWLTAPIQKIQNIADLTTYIVGKELGKLNGLEGEDLTHFASRYVDEMQTSAKGLDKPEMLNKRVWSLITPFANYAMNVYNQVVKHLHNKEITRTKRFKRYMAATLTFSVVPNMVVEMLTNRGEEDTLDKLKKAAEGGAAMSAFPVVGLPMFQAISGFRSVRSALPFIDEFLKGARAAKEGDFADVMLSALSTVLPVSVTRALKQSIKGTKNPEEILWQLILGQRS